MARGTLGVMVSAVIVLASVQAIAGDAMSPAVHEESFLPGIICGAKCAFQCHNITNVVEKATCTALCIVQCMTHHPSAKEVTDCTFNCAGSKTANFRTDATETKTFDVENQVVGSIVSCYRSCGGTKTNQRYAAFVGARMD